MALFGLLDRLAGLDDDGMDRARDYRAEARSIGLLPRDWDGESPLARCQLCRAFNRERFSHCRICAERLPLSTMPAEDCERAAVRGSGH